MKNEPILKWRKCHGGEQVGPFKILTREESIYKPCLGFAVEIDGYLHFQTYRMHLGKTACERLARKIIAALKCARAKTGHLEKK